MKKNSKFWLALVALTLLVGCSSKTPRESAQEDIWYLTTFFIDLTKAQEAQLKSIVDDWFVDYEKTIPNNQALYNEALLAIQNGQMDEERVKSILMERFEIQQQMVFNRLAEFNALLATLNEEQKKEILEEIASFKKNSVPFRYALGEIK